MELIKNYKISNLKKAEYNPGEMLPSEFLQLKESIKVFGFLEPILFHVATGIIVDGHHRYDACIEKEIEEGNALILGDLGWFFTDEEIKVKDENELKAMNIALRKIRGDFSQPKLQELVIDLKEQHFNLDPTGLNEVEVQDLIDDYYGTSTGDEGDNNSSGDDSPEDFPDVDEDLETDYCCPKCGYEWSGKPK